MPRSRSRSRDRDRDRRRDRSRDRDRGRSSRRSRSRDRRSRSRDRYDDRSSRHTSSGYSSAQQEAAELAARVQAQTLAQIQMQQLQMQQQQQFQMAAMHAVGGGGQPQSNKKQREVYIGNLTIGVVTSDMLKELFNAVLAQFVPDPATNPPVVSVTMDQTGRFGFVEMRTEELSEEAMKLDKIELCGRNINVGRPKGYVEPMRPLQPLPSLADKLTAERRSAAEPKVCVWVKNPMLVGGLRDSAGREELRSDFEAECSERCGPVTEVLVPKPPRMVSDTEAGRVYVKFATVEAAIKCQSIMQGRAFDGNILEAVYITPAVFDRIKGGEWVDNHHAAPAVGAGLPLPPGPPPHGQPFAGGMPNMMAGGGMMGGMPGMIPGMPNMVTGLVPGMPNMALPMMGGMQRLPGMPGPPPPGPAPASHATMQSLTQTTQMAAQAAAAALAPQTTPSNKGWVKMRGIPSAANKTDVVNFFADVAKLEEKKVHMVLKHDGQATGDAYIDMSDSGCDVPKAMTKDHQQFMSAADGERAATRYVELFPCNESEARNRETTGFTLV